MNGRKVVVVGGDTGYGQYISLKLAQSGAAHIVIICENREKVSTTREKIHAMGGKVDVLELNLTTKNHKYLVDKCYEILDDVDVLVNATSLITRKPLTQLTEYEIENTFKQNSLLPAYFMLHFSKRMVHHKIASSCKDYCIINITPMSPDLWATYAASKTALNEFSKKIAKELGIYKIRVMCVAPGALLDPPRSFIKSDPLHSANEKKFFKENKKCMGELTSEVVRDIIQCDWMSGSTIHIDAKTSENWLPGKRVEVEKRLSMGSRL